MGYTEPLRRFIQPVGYSPQVNEIPNTMPSWMPGQDYLINFQKGDPYIKVDEGYARLPGKGYEALHPELEGLNPEDYPDIARMRILSDVAPYSREYQKYSSRVRAQSRDNPALEAEYDRIVEQVRSTLQVAQKHFNAPVDTIEGSVKSVSGKGVELKEYPGRTFRFSSVGSSMADLTAEILGRSNRVTNTRCPFGVAHKIPSRMRGRAGTPPAAWPLRRPGALSILAASPARSTLRLSASGIMLSTASDAGWFFAGL
ncbi:MAG: hypothetical protein ABSE55_16750 [Terracidiphilus sp.]|jgi:hypothetical protein